MSVIKFLKEKHFIVFLSIFPCKKRISRVCISIPYNYTYYIFLQNCLLSLVMQLLVILEIFKVHNIILLVVPMGSIYSYCKT